MIRTEYKGKPYALQGAGSLTSEFDGKLGVGAAIPAKARNSFVARPQLGANETMLGDDVAR